MKKIMIYSEGKLLGTATKKPSEERLVSEIRRKNLTIQSTLLKRKLKKLPTKKIAKNQRGE